LQAESIQLLEALCRVFW